MAKYKKKRARELQHDKFRDTAGRVFDRVGDAGRQRKAILYGLGGVVLAGLIVAIGVKWSNRKADEARRALGRANRDRHGAGRDSVVQPLNPASAPNVFN